MDFYQYIFLLDFLTATEVYTDSNIPRLRKITHFFPSYLFVESELCRYSDENQEDLLKMLLASPFYLD